MTCVPMRGCARNNARNELMPMTRYVLRRIAISVVTILLIIVLLFLLERLMPGTPFNDEKLTGDQIAILYQKYGLDKPMWQQIIIYIKNMVTGDFGISYTIQKNLPISSMIAARFPTSIRIGAMGFVIGVTAGLLLGIFAALKHNSALDTAASVFSMIGGSVPSYVMGMLLLYFVAYKLKWVPLWYSNQNPFQSMLLPAFAMAIGPMSSVARYTRSEMIEAMNSEYVLLAEAKGMNRARVIFRHELRNVMIPIVTMIGPQFIGMITGSTVVESIFSVPGIGKLFVQAIQDNDYNVVLALAFIFSALFISVLLLVDVLYVVIDPRVRIAGGSQE